MFRADLREAFCRHRHILAAAGIYVAAVLAQAFWLKVPLAELGVIPKSVFLSMLTYVVFYLAIYPACVMASAVIAGAGREGTFRDRFAAMLERSYGRYRRGRLQAYSVAGFCVLAALNLFLVQKSLIPYLVPYQWDPFFAALDRALAFGVYPHEIVIPFVNGLRLLHVLDWSYAVWLAVALLMPAYAILFDGDLQRRMRFLWSYFLSWVVIGSLLAVVFSSVGPVFFRDFYPDITPDPYQSLQDNLARVNGEGRLMIAYGIGFLREWAQNDRMIDENALSAMPSLHIAMSLLVVFYAASLSRWLIAPAVLFFACIFLGSVYFGFHYAVDGYLAVILEIIIWWGSGKLVKKLHPMPEKLLPA